MPETNKGMRSDRNTAFIAYEKGDQRGRTAFIRDDWLINDFCTAFVCRLGIKIQVCTLIHTWPLTWSLIYMPLSQTMSINNDENLDKKVEDCRRKLLESPSCLARRPLKSILWSLSAIGRDRVPRRVNHLLASKFESLSHHGSQSFRFSQ